MPIITSDAYLAMVGSSAKAEARRSHRVIKAAHKAGTEAKPDWQARLKAAELNLRVLDAFPKPTLQPVDPSRPINVAIILSHGGDTRPQSQLSSHGVTLHLSDGGGDSA